MENNIMLNNNENKVLYDNSFNKTSLNLLTQVQSDVLMAVLSRMGTKKDEKDRFVADFHFKDIRETTKMSELYSSRLKNTLNSLLKTQVEFYDDEKYFRGNLFSNYQLTKKNEVRITLSTDMSNKMLINNKGYTVLEVSEYMNLKNKYSKELYRLLRQFRHTGLLVISKNNLLKALKPAKSYDEYETIRRALKPAIKDNEKYFTDLQLVNLEGGRIPDPCRFEFKRHNKSNMNTNNKSKEDLDDELLKYILDS